MSSPKPRLMEGTRVAGRRPFIEAQRLDALTDRTLAAQPGKKKSFPVCPAASDQIQCRKAFSSLPVVESSTIALTSAPCASCEI